MSETGKEATPAKEQATGIACPKCHCRHLYRVTRTSATIGQIDRRRECRNCGHRFTTREIIVTDQAKG